MDIEKVARAIEADAGMKLDDIRQGLEEMQAGVGRVTTVEQILVRSARAKTGLSQQAFAERIKTPVATLRDWEQGRFAPPGGVVCLLNLIGNHPDLIRELEAA
ncbi:putative transcriptional regulator [Gammaproteobacteria bacterium]